MKFALAPPKPDNMVAELTNVFEGLWEGMVKDMKLGKDGEKTVEVIGRTFKAFIPKLAEVVQKAANIELKGEIDRLNKNLEGYKADLDSLRTELETVRSQGMDDRRERVVLTDNITNLRVDVEKDVQGLKQSQVETDSAKEAMEALRGRVELIKIPAKLIRRGTIS